MEDFEKYYNKALRFLSYRPRSEKEIRFHFTKASRGRRIIPDEMIELIIKKLKEQRFLDDLEFARWWVEQRTTFKPRSLKLIKIELKQKGISDDLIEKAIYDLRFKNYDDLELARKLVEKRMARFRNKFGMTPEEIYQKLGRFLAQKGFDWDTIKEALIPIKSGKSGLTRF